MSRRVPRLGLSGRAQTRPASSWGKTGRSDIPDDRRHHLRELATNRETGEVFEVKLMRCQGERKLNARIASKNRDNQIFVGYSDKR